MRKISKIESVIPVIPKRKKVAAYARVSRESERLLHSLSAQVSYYSDFIQKNPGWEYAGVYVDEGITGTETDGRDEFNRLLADCDAGKIDIVLTKSISRFARNTVDLLEAVRHLRELGIEVRFEKENISSLSDDGELLLTLLASFAQEESRSISENVKWAIRKGFEQGKQNGCTRIYGYQWDGQQYIIIPQEAEIIRLIFHNYDSGISVKETERQLEEMGVKSLSGGHFGNSQIRRILQNERYAGDMLLQKYFVEDHISHKEVTNYGELPQFYVADTHEAIIDKALFHRVQDEMKRRREIGAAAYQRSDTSCFTSKIICGKCGRSFHRKVMQNKIKENTHKWKCYSKAIRQNCGNCDMREEHIMTLSSEVLGLDDFDAEVFTEKIEKVVVVEPRDLIFCFKDGRKEQRHCEYDRYQDFWTPEMRKRHSAFMSKENVKRWETRRHAEGKKCNNDSGND